MTLLDSIADVSDEAYDLGPVPTRIEVSSSTVAQLVHRQFPHWAELPIRSVATPGWDNRTFHLGDDLLVRLPSAAEYALAVQKEHRWLPVIAPRVPLPIPEPVALGAPDDSYPHPWSIYRWLPGEPADRSPIADLDDFATSLADFLGALQAIDADDGPGPGVHNWFRGGPLTTYAAQVEEDVKTLTPEIPVGTVAEIWQHALDAPWSGQPVWFHGDVAVGNLLVDDGRLAAVIDFGTCGVGDPACDLAIAWTLLDSDSRTTFRDRLEVDGATWSRGRGWALWKALSGSAGATRSGDPRPVDSDRVLAEIIDDWNRQ